MLKLKLLVFLVLYVFLKFSYVEVKNFLHRGKVMLDFINVGQGDSILITTPFGKKILIDGGPNYDSDIFIDDRLPFFNCFIDYIVLTHPDADHLTGVNRVLKRCKVGLLVFPEVALDSKLYQDFIKTVKTAEGLDKQSNKSFSAVLDGATFYFLFPSESANLEIKNTNDYSVFLCLDYGSFEALFTGDASTRVLKSMVPVIKDRCNINGPLEVLKVPHHGSKYNYDEYFVDELKPLTAVISVGRNKFGHPDPQIIDKYLKNKASVLRTDTSGTISIVVHKDKSFKLN